MQELLHHPAFLFFLQCELPEVQRYWRAPQGPGSPLLVCLTTPEQCSVLMVQDSDDTGTWTICEYGGGDLWRRVQECYTRWEQFGKPATTSYAFTFIDGEQWVTLSQLAGQWRIASA